jgi:ribosomal-protein-alanine N-acetyltransferase
VTVPEGRTEGAGQPRPAARAADCAANGVALREMRWWDMDAVLALEHDLFPEDAWSRGMFWSELADARHPAGTRTYLVAEDGGGRIVGYAGLAAVAGTGDVQTIATARDHWGTGLGSALLSALLRAATAAECHEVLLEVRVDNSRAQRLYERFGFVPIGIRRGYYQPGNVDALVMRLADPRQDAAQDASRDVPGNTQADVQEDTHGDVQETGIHG